MSSLADSSPSHLRQPPSPNAQSLPSSPHRPPPPPSPSEQLPVNSPSPVSVGAISGTSLNDVKGVVELRFVLPVAAIESHRGSWISNANVPQIKAFDPPIPAWLAKTCGGCCRLSVTTRQPKREGPCGVSRLEYACELPLMPARLVVCLDTAVADGDCRELNALRLKPEVLIKRTCIRVGDDAQDIGAETSAARDVATVYCNADVQTERVGIVGMLIWPILPLARRFLRLPVRRIAKELLEEHFRGILSRHSFPVEGSEIRRKTSYSGSAPTSETPAVVGIDMSSSPVTPSGRGGGALGSTSPELGSPMTTPRVNELAFAHPSLTKGMPFYNGYLYKLGDGILNRTWNLRYFLLIGPTLHYFLSPHEAKPRDVFNLKGAIVQWIKDQTRPFAFTVTFKDGQQRPLYLSGEDWKDTQEWIDRILAAGKNSSEGQDGKHSANLARRRPSKLHLLGLASEAPKHETSLQVCAQALQGCVHASQISGQGCRLRELHNGLRIFEYVPENSGTAPSAHIKDATYEMCCWLAVMAFLTYTANSIVLNRLLTSSGVYLLFALACSVAAFWYVFLKKRIPNPIMIFACSRIDCPLDELRDILAEPSFYAEWQPDHLQGRFLSLWGEKDEVLLLRFRSRYGFWSGKVQFKARRRWSRGENGARFLCAVAETEVEHQFASVEGCEGFAVIPIAGEEHACMVVWLCGLRLASSAPQWLQKRLAVRRVCALAGLRDWVSCGRPHASRANRGAARDFATTKDPSKFSVFLRGFQCAASGSLYVAADLERAAVMTSLVRDLSYQMLWGGKSLSIVAAAHGMLPSDGLDVAHCYASRWAYASTFLAVATTADQPRDRILQVVAFAVAGLHLVAASFPHFPWMPRPLGTGRYTAKLSNDVHIRVEPQSDNTASSGSSVLHARGSSFEARSNAGVGYRIHGTDEVVCKIEFPGALRFSDRGVTTVDLSGNVVRYTAPELRVRASDWSFGRGSIYEWLGSMHFVDVSGNIQCDLCFGSARGEASDSISGSLRDSHGLEMGRIHGSWLGPLLCDNQVLWRGPRLQPPVC